MTKPFDATLNSLIDNHLQEWVDYLAARIGVASGPVTPLDTDLSANFQADRLFRLERDPVEAIHLELESSGHLGIPDRLLRYNVFATNAQRLPVFTVVILLRPAANATDLTSVLQRQYPDGTDYLMFRYTVIRLWEESSARLLNAGPGLAPLAMLTNDAAGQLEETLVEVHTRLEQANIPRSEIKEVLGSTYVLCGLRYQEARLQQLFTRFSMTLEDSTTYQAILNKGITQGVTQGITQGRSEGITVGQHDGRLEEAKRLLVNLGTRRFGPPTSEQLAAIQTTAELDKLEHLFETAFTATDWASLLSTPST